MYVQKLTRGVRHGDRLVRRKTNGMGLHYGRVVRTTSVVPWWKLAGICPLFLAAHETPKLGKHTGLFREFFGNQPDAMMFEEMTELQRDIEEMKTLSDLGRRYSLLHNCEDDALGFSPTRDFILRLLIAGGFVVFGGVAINAMFPNRK